MLLTLISLLIISFGFPQAGFSSAGLMRPAKVLHHGSPKNLKQLIPQQAKSTGAFQPQKGGYFSMTKIHSLKSTIGRWLSKNSLYQRLKGHYADFRWNRFTKKKLSQINPGWKDDMCRQMNCTRTVLRMNEIMHGMYQGSVIPMAKRSLDEPFKLSMKEGRIVAVEIPYLQKKLGTQPTLKHSKQAILEEMYKHPDKKWIIGYGHSNMRITSKEVGGALNARGGHVGYGLIDQYGIARLWDPQKNRAFHLPEDTSIIGMMEAPNPQKLSPNTIPNTPTGPPHP